MNLKKEAVKRIQALLQEEISKINGKLLQNRYTFKKLTEEQTILKREKTKLQEVWNLIDGD